MVTSLPGQLKFFLLLSALTVAMMPTGIGGATNTNLVPGSHQRQTAPDSPVLLAQQTRTRRINFKVGESSAIVRDAVVRGTRDVYLLGAQQGQTMTVKIESLENNAVFDVLTPPTKNGQRRILKQEAMSWSGKLPASGDYQIVVGGTRGNASYKLQVAIK